MKNEDLGIPTIELAKAKPKEGSAAWMERVSREQGDTEPLLLEERRLKVGAFAVSVFEGIKQLQMMKKSALSAVAKQEKALSDAIDKGDSVEALQSQLAELYQFRDSQAQQFELLLMQQKTNYAMIEAMCLLVDSMTIREEVKVPGKKVGFTRYSVALILDSISYDVGKVTKSVRKIRDSLIPPNPTQDEEDEAEEEFTGSEADVVSREDRENIKKSATEEK